MDLHGIRRRREPREGDRTDRHHRHARLAVCVSGRRPDRPALEAAAEKQIIHRNIKPANILIRKVDNVAKLGDLMLAKALSELSAQQITRPGQMVGDLAYMSPERTGSDPNAVDTRSDIYNLGATLYALLTGHPPFQGSMVELVRKIRNEPPARPKKFQLSIPDLFEGSIMRMLAKDPGDRFQTPTELLRDFERVAKFNGVTLDA